MKATIVLVVLCVMLVWSVILFCKHMDFSTTNSTFDEAPKITYEAFISFYALHPSKWTLYEDMVRYDWTKICFKSFRDYLKYQRFYKRETERIAETNRIKNERDFIKALQKDVDDYRKENLCEIERLLEK